MTTNVPILQIDDIEIFYEQTILAVRSVSLEVKKGQVVALLGANGAGKSTTLKAVSNLVRAERGEVVRGRIVYQGKEVTRSAPHWLAAKGLVQVLEGRHCFAQLTVEENLLSGALARQVPRRQILSDLEWVYGHFPRLKLRRKTPAGYTSGGEQQMIAIGRALMAKPQLVLLDEPSMGLAPQIVEEIFEIIRQLNQQEGVSFLIAEQNINVALRYAHFGYVLENGRVVSEGSAEQLAARSDLQDFYLGARAEARTSSLSAVAGSG
ncbi:MULTISPECIES: ABC transporter ATP-binding protein [unclassified Pseudomonas]|uniref:ABC transporter ATP-binding protein n=1 Tax=unclassified Pseudomonas TaxID=196821 RepID=UPI00053697B5|nr:MULTISPECIES: ABC transporter ATP-binding protein [unclassified Pseudomonas]MBD0687730.1 ABC transporter ATP-binding protein [Pseudomonas sp. PSB18]CDF94722.1 Branched-chain amino acid transport ATP-binding protein LivF (TC 3.A.1.4.1) [Pseudomonas sp. SHC52]